jgi:class 3 adenylate cyclase
LARGSANDRKLAAIMVADVVGFSRLMERDESLTFARLRRLREEVTFPKIEEHGGRLVKTTGDGFLAEFGSAMAAVKCGIEIQRNVVEVEAEQADADRIRFRIGLNVGDIIIDGDDVAGDGVNIAARLETLSPADGMCIASSVREQIRDDLGVRFEYMGEQTLKNISRPIRAYAVHIVSDVAEAGQPAPQAAVVPAPSLDHLVEIETDFDAVLGASGGASREGAGIAVAPVDQAQREAADQALTQAMEQTRTDAQAVARLAAEAEAKRAEDERHRKEGEAQARRREEQAREQEHAEMQARLAAQNHETERHFAEMEKELEAEQAVSKGGQKKPHEPRPDARKRGKDGMGADARVEAAVRSAAVAAAAAAAPVANRTPVNWGKPVALGFVLILIVGLVLIHFVSFDRFIPQFEKMASAHLRQPVTIKALHLSLVPPVHWRLDGVSVGNDGRLTVASIDAVPELGSLFGDKKVFKSLALDSPALSEEGLFALLFGKPEGRDFNVASVSVKNGRLKSKTVILPALDAKIAIGEDGAWRKITLETADHKTNLSLEPKGGGAQLEIATNAFSMPFGPAFILEDFSATGVLSRDELRLSEFKGAGYGGYLSGNASLKWGAGWSLGGDISYRAMDPVRIAPALFAEGKLEGRSAYAMRARSYDELFAAPRMEGNFLVQKGTLLGVDLTRLLQGDSGGGKTVFAELAGNFIYEGGRTQLRQIHLRAGPLTAGGNADVDAGKNISGRFAVEVKSPVAQARADFTVSGTLREPRFNR